MIWRITRRAGLNMRLIFMVSSLIAYPASPAKCRKASSRVAVPAWRVGAGRAFGQQLAAA
jgi:hypothetical protein